MSHSLTLYRLQQTDSQTDRHQARLKVIQQTLEDDGELRQARERAEEAAAAFKAAQVALHQAEEAVRSQRIKIEQAESNLYGGNVRIPKELQDLQNDVASLKRHLATLEDRQLEAMLALDDVSAVNKVAQTNQQAIAARVLEANQSLAGERDSLLREVENLSAERQAITGDLPADVLANYESLRTQRRGLAVAVVKDKACSACGTTLTPMQVQNLVISADLAYCPTCTRILYSG